jgi:hypothetical protein
MGIDTQAQLISVEVVHGVKVPKECVSNEEKISILPGKSTFMNHKITFIIICFVKVLVGLNLENIVTHLKPYRFDFLCYRITTFHHVTESRISGAIQSWQCFCPVLSDLVEDIRRN